ncbi:MAG: hypothetical protein P8X42_03255 [Calditrichaceae bacterium]|jgi:hypothetical protein
MRIALSIFLFIHGISHVVGFLIPWQIVKSDEMPYKTSLFFDKIDLGSNGIKIYGILWLLLALTFFLSAWFVVTGSVYWFNLTLCVSICSFIFCILSLPDSKIGVIANIILFIFFLLNNIFHWLV